MRLIDADALMQAMYNRAFETDGDTMWQSGCWVRYRAIEQVVKEQPTVEERKTGKWRICTEEIEETFHTGSRCTVCNYWKPMGIWKYCPECGARME